LPNSDLHYEKIWACIIQMALCPLYLLVHLLFLQLADFISQGDPGPIGKPGKPGSQGTSGVDGEDGRGGIPGIPVC